MRRLYETTLEQLSTRLQHHRRVITIRTRDAWVHGSLTLGWAAATAVTIIDGRGLAWLAWAAGVLVWGTATTWALASAAKHRRLAVRAQARVEYLREIDRVLRRNTPKRHL